MDHNIWHLNLVGKIIVHQRFQLIVTVKTYNAYTADPIIITKSLYPLISTSWLKKQCIHKITWSGYMNKNHNLYTQTFIIISGNILCEINKVVILSREYQIHYNSHYQSREVHWIIKVLYHTVATDVCA